MARFVPETVAITGIPEIVGLLDVLVEAAQAGVDEFTFTDGKPVRWQEAIDAAKLIIAKFDNEGT